MNVKRVRKILSFIESLSETEKKLLESIIFSEIKTRKVPVEKRKKRKNNGFQHYDDDQIRYAWKLKTEGFSNKEIAKKTGLKKGSVMRGYLKRRLQKMQEKIPRDNKISTF